MSEYAALTWLTRNLGRYSNTLLVSFNNRVSIRDGGSNQSGVIRSGGGSFPSNTVPSEDSHILLVDMKKTVKSKALPMDGEAPERVISELPRPFFPFPSCSVLWVLAVVDIK
jgi:hypothetical protein